MQYFTEQAYTHSEALEKIRRKYGERAKILTHRAVRMGGFMGLFSKEGIEVTGYISSDLAKKRSKDLEETKSEILKNVQSDQTLKQISKDVQELKKFFSSSSGGEMRHEEEKHPTIMKIEKMLSENEFTDKYISSVSERIKREFSIGELEDFELVQSAVIEWIGESISVHKENNSSGPKVFILVGPTGVGKTTTIAKLAALNGLGTSGMKTKSVRMLTIDNYRIAARQQIETYGGIMGIPVACIETRDDLQQKLGLFGDVDLILIDTIGKSPKDYKKLAEMNEILSECGSKAERHLAISASTKTSDIYEILRQFEPFHYQSVILTKLDETSKIGNIISILSENRKSISYITDGQKVPQDISPATVQRLLMQLDGFHIKRDWLEKRFPDKIAQ
ncbi:MAG: flagellar biosynthesis protein FlhF [Spirochaetia bacterium]